MCGILGIVGCGADEIEDALRSGLGFLRERGPDHDRVWVGQQLGLAHARLSIIDLDPRAHQPFNVDERVVLSFNGEIYNFRELRSELESAGHRFCTTSDTEVIARGFLQWGIEVVRRLDGMFAFALLDVAANSLYLARDPFGQKPLYVFKGEGELFFCSDIRPIQARYRSHLTLNFDALDYYLTELCIPQPMTIWNEVSQVPPAAIRKISLASGETTESSYWAPSALSGGECSEKEALQAVETAILEAVRKRTVSDVPIGCFLSGGVDSGLVVSMLCSQVSGTVKTFTVSLEGHSMDEGPLARQVAQRYSTEHTEVTVSANLERVTRIMSEYCGEPFADASVLPSYLICGEISKHLKVALSGDGGDEVFGGYPQYMLAYRTDRFLRKTSGKRFLKTRVFADKVLSRFSGRENLGSYEHYARKSGAERLLREMGLPPSVRNQLWKKEFVKHSVSGESILAGRWDSVESDWISDHLMRASLSTRLLNGYLVKVDRASMVHSLEVRSPFLDRELADLAFSLPPDLKFKNFQSKYVLKKLAEKYVSPDIFAREKTGFSIPLGEWMRAGPLDFAKDFLLDRNSWIYQWFEYSVVKNLWGKHARNDEQTHGLWALLCLELWARETGLR